MTSKTAFAGETLPASVTPPRGLAGHARKALRGGILAAAALAQRPSKGPFLRCLGGHYVFDDQRGDFETLLTRLRDLGEFVTTADLIEMITGRLPIDGRYFHLSFDDGLGCIARNAVPALAERAIPATLFVNSAVVSGAAPETRAGWEKATNYRQSLTVMSWDELRSAAAAGIEIGAHTRTHSRLSQISGDPARLEAEIAGCKRDIEAEIPGSCRAIAWPYGSLDDIDATALAAIDAAGFEAAFSLVRAPIVPGQTSPLAIPRHHFEPQWPWREIRYFAQGGREHPLDMARLRAGRGR